MDGRKSLGNDERRTNEKGSSTPFPWRKERSSTAILNSAYRRIHDDGRDDIFRHRGSMPVALESYSSRGLQQAPSLQNAETPNPELNMVKKTEPKGKNQKLTLNIAAAKALSKSWTSLSEQSDQQENESGVIRQILPAITDFSLNVAMKSGSLDSVAPTGKEKSSPNFSFLKSPEGKRTHPPLKSVSPKILYKVDPQSSVFDYSSKATEKEPSGSDVKKGDVNSETSNGANQDTCGKQAKKAKNGKSLAKQKSPSIKLGKSIDISNLFHRTLSVASAHRRRHSSDDVAVLTKECASTSSNY